MWLANQIKPEAALGQFYIYLRCSNLGQVPGRRFSCWVLSRDIDSHENSDVKHEDQMHNNKHSMINEQNWTTMRLPVRVI